MSAFEKKQEKKKKKKAVESEQCFINREK